MSAKPFLWPAAAKTPPLSGEQIHVYAWALGIPPLPTQWQILNEEESARARRFVFPEDRDRFVRAHAIMREVLSGHIGIAPNDLRFVTGAYGKPRIAAMPGTHPLLFNLTHSADIALLAVTRHYQVGIDVEVLRPMDRDIAELNFSPHELLTLASLADNDWLAGFYRCWTSKEALLKGEGLGLNLPLHAFDVEANPQLNPALLACREPKILPSHWRLFDLRPADGVIGTLAVRDDTESLSANSIHHFSIPL